MGNFVNLQQILDFIIETWNYVINYSTKVKPNFNQILEPILLWSCSSEMCVKFLKEIGICWNYNIMLSERENSQCLDWSCYTP